MAQVPVTSGPNRNKYWLNNRGMWLGYLTTVAILHFLILSIPFLTTPQAWTLTHVIHNLVSSLAASCNQLFLYISVLQFGEGISQC